MACTLAASLPQRLTTGHTSSDYPGNSSVLIGTGVSPGAMSQRYEDGTLEKVRSFQPNLTIKRVEPAGTRPEANGTC